MSFIKVSVVMPVFNGEKTIREAIDSILNQSMTDLELIIINDGSTDSSENVILSYRDPRIIYIKQNNKGVSAALNNGINTARGEYIARLDCDDVAHSERLKTQSRFLDNNMEYVLVGSSVNYIDERSILIGRSFHVISDFFIRKQMNIMNAFSHPSVMFKKSAYCSIGDNGYDEKLSGHFEDYYLWTKLLTKGKGYNIHMPLTNYRITQCQITTWVPPKKYLDIMYSVIHHNDFSNVSLLKEIKSNYCVVNDDLNCRLNKIKNRRLQKYFTVMSNIFGYRLSSYLLSWVRTFYFIIK